MSGNRLHIGKAHEDRVAESLRLRGWTVQPWGQGLLIPEIRSAFVEADADQNVLFWRWMADLIAVRHKVIYIVEAKSEQRDDTPFFSIELSCLVAQRLMTMLGLRHVVVWANGSCNYIDQLRIAKTIVGHDSARVATRGSGTPFALVRKADQLSLDEILGPRLESWSAA